MLARLARLAGGTSAPAGAPAAGGPAGPGLAGAHSREPAADFRTLVLPHLDAAYNLARYLARDPITAEDIAQEAMLRAFRAFGGYRGGSSKAWLLAIVRNCFLTTVQARGGESHAPRTMSLATPDEQRPEAIEHETPETEVMRSDQIEAVRRLIERLPEPFREALVLRELEDLSYKEIAAITEVPIGTVMSRLARARRLLAEHLEPLR